MDIIRRGFIVSMGTGALALGHAGRALGAHKVIERTDGYFLSDDNPIANRDQRDLEALAIDLLNRPDMQRAIARNKATWARVTSGTVSPEAWTMFDSFHRSYVVRSISVAVNDDANYPKILRVYNPAAKWLGNDVPDSRWGSENPDNCYRIIPVQLGGKYAIHGWRAPCPAQDSSYVLVADTNTSVTESLLELRNMEIRNDGSFTITLDETPANGRRNHLQLTPFARFVFNRDSMSDWNQTPNRLHVERLNPPSRAPLSNEELVDRAYRIMHDGTAQLYYWIRTKQNIKVGELRKPQSTGESGGLLTQISGGASFLVADDEAYVITTDPVEADYFSIVAYDPWDRTLEYRDHQSSLNNAQMVADADGRFTFVMTNVDPGIHNWVDVVGVREARCGLRWQGIKPGAKVPNLEGRKVKLSDLTSALPKGVRRINAQQRTLQIAERQKSYDRRFLDR